MGGGKGSSVPQVDMENLVRVQGAVNRPDVFNPYGSSEWTNEGDHYTQTQTFNPETQALYEGQLDYMGQGANQFQAQQLPSWLESMGRGAMSRVSDRFDLGATEGEDLKPTQQMPNAPNAIDMQAIRDQANQQPGTGGPGGPGGSRFGNQTAPWRNNPRPMVK